MTRHNLFLMSPCSQVQTDEGVAKQKTQMDGKDIVNKYYEYYNASNIDGVMSLMAEDCKYHDMIYSDPFEGHEEIRAYFDKV